MHGIDTILFMRNENYTLATLNAPSEATSNRENLSPHWTLYAHS